MNRADLPAAVRADLLARWGEPHRHYHGMSHLTSGLGFVDELGGGRLDRIAFWFHDAVHSNTTPDDERASADVARALLDGVLPPADVDEVVRLVLVTIDHSPSRGDAAGALISDADLAALAMPWEGYLGNVAGIRAELPHVGDEAWRVGRSAVLERLLAGDRLFHTARGFALWEAPARANLRRELDALRA